MTPLLLAALVGCADLEAALEAPYVLAPGLAGATSLVPIDDHALAVATPSGVVRVAGDGAVMVDDDAAASAKALAQTASLYLVAQVADEATATRVRDALAARGVVGDDAVPQHRFLPCTTSVGHVAVVRQVKPSTYITGARAAPAAACPAAAHPARCAAGTAEAAGTLYRFISTVALVGTHPAGTTRAAHLQAQSLPRLCARFPHLAT